MTDPSGSSLLHAINTIASWLDAGECGKKTADNFYVYLQGLRTKLRELQATNTERTKQRQQEDAMHLIGLISKVGLGPDLPGLALPCSALPCDLHCWSKRSMGKKLNGECMLIPAKLRVRHTHPL